MWSFLTFRKDDFSRYIFYDCFCVSVIFQVIKKHRVFRGKVIWYFLQLDQLSGGIVAVGGDFAVPADQYEIVKEQMVQTTSKKIVRSSEKQKPCTCVPHISYVRTEGFVRATVCYGLLVITS